MKKSLLTSITLLLAVGITNAQMNCKLMTDSIIGGSDSTAYEVYFYDDLDRIVRVDEIDSNQTEVYQYDTLIYTPEGFLDSVNTYYTWDNSLRGVAKFTYDAQGRAIRVENSGDNGNGPWTKAHNIIYNGSGEMTDMLLDAFSISGDPEGMMANFQNMVWENGNITYAELIGDLGGGQVDTLEMSLSYDNKKNVEAHFYIDEATDFILYNNANNVTIMEFINDEVFGSAGTVAMQYSYTYTVDDEVETRQDHPGVFSENISLTMYRYECSDGTSVKEVGNNQVKIYPNPTKGIFSIDLENDKHANVSISDLSGRIIMSRDFSSSQIEMDLSAYSKGVYFINIETEKETLTYKMLKE